MNIDKDTKIMKRGIRFTDGANGSFSQQWELSVDGEKLGVTFCASKDTEGELLKYFSAADGVFDTFYEAAIAAGHEVVI